MHTLGQNLRLGGGLSFIGGYEIQEKLPEDSDRDQKDVEAFELGQLVTPFARAEFLVPFLGDKALVLGAAARATGACGPAS